MNETKNRAMRLTLLGRFWRRHGWLIIGLLWIGALILAFIGFGRNAAATGQSLTLFDRAYLTFQLIPMNSGAVAGPVSWELQATRFLIPFLAAWTAIRALLSLFRDRWQQFLLRFWRGHVIICGLSRKGWLLAQGFAGRGDRVVVIEADEGHGLIESCRERGIVVLVGDATNPDVLRSAGILAAGQLVAVTDDDGVNAEIAVRGQGLLRQAAMAGHDRSRPLTCTVHLVDPQLYELARTREMALEAGVPLRLELFNVFERGARLLWSEYGPARGVAGGGSVGAAPDQDEPGATCAAHVLVIGLGRLSESLIVTAGRDWHTRLHESFAPGVPSAGGVPPERGAVSRLRITVVDLEAEWKCRALSLRYPGLASVCDLIPQTMDVRWPEFYAGDFLNGRATTSVNPGQRVPPVSVVFVCFDDDSLGLRTGLAVQRHVLRASASPPPVVVRMAETGGLARLIAPDGHDHQITAFANLHAFGLLDRTCTPEAILGGTHEVLARGLHEVYIQRHEALGGTSVTNSALVEWDKLPDALRESNRAQADGIVDHLAALGYTLIPLTDWNAAPFHFSKPEVEFLATREHSRFVAERRSHGWRYTSGPKDIDAMLSPALVSWNQLSDAERSKNCDTIRELPVTLARAGFQIVRLIATGQDGMPNLSAEEPDR